MVDDIINNSLNGLLVASPANPTGSMLNKDDLEKLMDACKMKQTVFISDERMVLSMNPELYPL